MLKSIDIVEKGYIFVPTNKLKLKTMTNLEINQLLDKNIEVYWNSGNYIVKRENNGNLIVVCICNGYTSGLHKDELKDCGINKWDARELNLQTFKVIR